MYFLDLKKREIVEVASNWTLAKYIVNADILDKTPKDAEREINRVLRVSFADHTVLVSFLVEDVDNQDDFEIMCDLLVSAWFFRNAKAEIRPQDELRLAVPQKLVPRLNCDYTSIKHAIDHEFYNRYFNVVIESVDGNYKYELIGPPENESN